MPVADRSGGSAASALSAAAHAGDGAINGANGNLP